MAARSYLVHEIDVNEESIEELFIKCDLSYMKYLFLDLEMDPNEP